MIIRTGYSLQNDPAICTAVLRVVRTLAPDSSKTIHNIEITVISRQVVSCTRIKHISTLVISYSRRSISQLECAVFFI